MVVLDARAAAFGVREASHASAATIVGGSSTVQVAANPTVGVAAFAMHEARIARPPVTRTDARADGPLSPWF